MRKSDELLGTNTPLVEAAHVGGRQRPKAILIRTSWTTGDKGAANAIAQAWHISTNRQDSCHYVVDEAQTIRCVPDKFEAFYATPRKKGIISINICHNPPEPPDPEILYRLTKLTARLCRLYNIRVRILTEDEEERWLKHSWKSRGGIILRTVGAFPTKDFFYLLEDEYTKQTGR